MKSMLITLMLLWSSLAAAKTVSVEFKFTPYTGDSQEDQVQAVPGKARIFINNMFYAEQEVAKGSVLVMFDERDISPSVWLPMYSVGPILRQGKNSIRIEFQPGDAKAPYNAQLSWASVMDESVEVETSPGSGSASNQSGEGKDTRQVTGKVVFEREFAADFASDQAWHHYPAVTVLSAADKEQIAALISARAIGFKPDFAAVYGVLASKDGMDVAAIRKSKCIDSAYAVGVRVAVPAADQLQFSLSGNPEVTVERKGGALFDMGREELFGKIKENLQMCAGMSLMVAFPPRLSFVHTPAGVWEVVY